MTRFPLFVFLGGLIAMGAVLGPQASTHQTRPQAIPLGSLAHLFTVQVQINGSGPYTFIVDTGAGVNVINQELVSGLDIPVVGTTEIGSPMGDKPESTDLLEINSLSLGDVVIEEAEAVAMNLTEIFSPLPPPDGILAAAAVEDHILTIDFPAENLIIRKGSLAAADGHRILDYDASSDVPRLAITVGGVVAEVALDCGAPSGLTLPSSYIDKLTLESAPMVTGRGRTIDAEFEIRTSKLLGKIQFGDISIDNPTIVFNDKSPHGNMGIRI